MTMQVRLIALYHRDGRIRTINFKLGSVNIITGKSRTGKSAIIDILDYCMGRSTFNIFEGVNRQVIAWYAVVLQFGDTQVLLMKPPPEGASRSQSRVYMKVASEISLPPLDEVTPNTNDESVTKYLSQLVGISPNQTDPGEARTTVPFEATIDHTKFYLFQEQGLVANRKMLFHRQDEQFIPQHIKDTMPYFLGAVQEDRLEIAQQLKLARRKLTEARRRVAEAEAVVGTRLAQAQSLLAEAKDAGIIETAFDTPDLDGLLTALRTAATWTPARSTVEAGNLLTAAQEELQRAQSAFGDKSREVQEAEKFLWGTRNYRGEAEQQALRLQSIGILSSNDVDTSVCPVCTSRLEEPPPQVTAISRALSKIQQDLVSVRREEPRLQEHVASLQEELEVLRTRVHEARRSVNALIREREATAQLQDANTRAAHTSGRISMYIDNVEALEVGNFVDQSVGEAERRVKELETQLDLDEVEDLKKSALSIISGDMTTWAARLKMEHAGNPYRLDDRQLTVIVDTPERPVPMTRMGSAENWLGCHVIALSALHKHFVRRGRPVPGFLLLDQPSQVYFPSADAYKALDGDLNNLEAVGADVLAVRRLFDFLFDITEELEGKLQIIVMEHANFEDARFQQALVEQPWFGDRALIPPSWI